MSVGQNPPFAPAAILTISASTTSVGAALPASGESLVVTNPLASLAWVAIGGGTSSATAVPGACIPVLPGQRRIIAASGITQVAAVLASGTGSIYIETGSGSAV